MSDGKKLDRMVTTRFPKTVYQAIESKANSMRKDFPRFNSADVIRLAVVFYLKEKGFLEKKEEYL